MRSEPQNLTEIATGRLYVDGEPEVRLRRRDLSSVKAADTFIVVSKLGEQGHPVGILSSVFSRAPGAPHAETEVAAKAYVSALIEASGGAALHQEVDRFQEMPADLARYLVIHMLGRAKALLSE